MVGVKAIKEFHNELKNIADDMHVMELVLNRMFNEIRSLRARILVARDALNLDPKECEK